MLTLFFPAKDSYDDIHNLFISNPAVTLQLEHSLLSISKWEATWHKPFLTKTEKTNEEFVDYVRCMTINSHVDSSVYTRIGPKEFKKIQDYIDNPMTATTFSSAKKTGQHGTKKAETVTSELIYYWLSQAQIPFEVEKWHLNRLMALLRIVEVKNNNEKMSKKDLYNHHRSLNSARRAAAKRK